MSPALPVPRRSRVGWWLLVLGLGSLFAYVLFSFLGTFVFGLFVYYGLRPLQQRLQTYVPRDLSAVLALVVVALPVLVFLSALAVVGITELLAYWNNSAVRTLVSGYVDPAVVENPAQRLQDGITGDDLGIVTGTLAAGASVLAFLGNVLLHLFIAATVAFYLLRDDDHVRAWFEGNVASPGTPAHAYLTAVDRDLATIYFGNVLLVGVVGLVAATFYNVYNVLAPASVSIPFPTMLGLLTGFASMVPIVVGKLVYVPLVVYLGTTVGRTDPSLLVFPIGLFVACLVFLDLVPMALLLPRIAGRKTHVGLVLFAYILGPVLFGWYGLFLGPLVLVLGIQLVRIGFTELLHGEPLTPTVTAAGSIGSDPDRASDDTENASDSTDGDTDDTSSNGESK